MIELQSQTHGDPCPHCGGTEFYCAEEVEDALVELHAGHKQARDRLQVEVGQLRTQLEQAREQLCSNRQGRWEAEKEAKCLRETLEWINEHDQTKLRNGGDPEWFAEQAPSRARKALYEK